MGSPERRTVRMACICETHMVDLEVEGNEVINVSMAPIPENRWDTICSKAPFDLILGGLKA